MHQDARRRRAHLALVVHDADVRPFGSLLEVRVAEDDKRRLAARLESDVLHRPRGHLHDLLTGGRGAREGDLVDVGMVDERGASDAAQAIDDVDDTRREAGFLDEVGEVEDAEGGLFGGLQDDGVSAGERGAQLPGGHGQREVPGDDLADDADGLAQSVGEFLMGRVDGLVVSMPFPSMDMYEPVRGLYPPSRRNT